MIYKRRRRLCLEAGIPYRATHVLRHSFISIHGQHGQAVAVLSAHVGHARASFTLDQYRTVFDKERAALTINFSPLTKDSERPP
ncbi:hypothetical protein SU48_12515 [Deinococcus puniceus]|uniref:Tyr recombinase domain-containing protein n=1 Tax=Deinococcus puniceus TaxID=1182568 RepID=A0A172TBP4_9DEIO|nr:hypothetical protein SU48_12515 [Deinococcus puniceus]